MEWNGLRNFGRRHHEGHFCEIIFINLDQWFRSRYHLEIFLVQLWWPFRSVEQNNLCNFGRGHSEEHFCIIILHLGSGGNVV